MRALLTGGTGFIGRALVRLLRSQGATIGLLTRAEIAKPADVGIFAASHGLWSEEAILTAIGAFKPDAIFHLAGGPQESLADLYEANVLLGERLISAAAHGAARARVVLIGSAAEYGPPNRPDGVLEEDAPCRPNTAYGVAKLAQTLNGLVRARAGQPITIARLFNPVGPGMPGGLAFSAFARRLASGAPTLATGDIDAARDFFSVDEAARIITDIAANADTIGQIVNVCSGIAQPVRRGVAQMVARIGRPIRLVHDPALTRPDDPPVVVGGVRTLEAFGIRPASHDIKSALDALLDDFAATAETRPSTSARASSAKVAAG